MTLTGGEDSPFWWRDTVGEDVHVAFTCTRAGNLAPHVGREDSGLVSRRRRDLEARMGVAPRSLRFLDQVHSSTVLDAEAHHASDGAFAQARGDAWVSPSAAEPLAVMVADCLPVLLLGESESSSGAVTAAAHAGREGLLGGVLENTVTVMREHGAGRVTAWIGPAACGCCYEVPSSMREQLSMDRPALASETRWGTAALDLRAEADDVLGSLGVRVAQLAGCTIEDESLFSHRRAPGEGRFAGLIWRTPARV